MNSTLRTLVERDIEMLLELYGTIENLAYRYAYVIDDPDPIAMGHRLRNWLKRVRTHPSWQSWAIIVGLIALRPQLVGVVLEFNIYMRPRSEEHYPSVRAVLWQPDTESHNKMLENGYRWIGVTQATNKREARKEFRHPYLFTKL